MLVAQTTQPVLKESASWRALRQRFGLTRLIGLVRGRKKGKKRERDEPALEKGKSQLKSAKIEIISCREGEISGLKERREREEEEEKRMRRKWQERGSNLRRQLSPSDQPRSTVSVRTVALKLVTKPILLKTAEWSERQTSRRAGWLGAAAIGSIPTLVTFFSFSSLLLLFLSFFSKPIFLLSTRNCSGYAVPSQIHIRLCGSSVFKTTKEVELLFQSDSLNCSRTQWNERRSHPFSWILKPIGCVK